MPEQRRQSALLGKLGNKFKQAVENHANDEFRPGMTSLPGGVRGIAHVNSLKIGVYEKGDHKGQPFFTAMASVVYPPEHVGGQTKWGPEPMCDTPEMKGKWEGAPTTFDDHWAKINNILMMIGGDRYDPSSLAEADDFDAAINELFDTLLDPENPVYISFETRQKPPDKVGPRAGQEKPVNHYWNNRTNWSPVDEQAARTTDETATPAAKPSANGAGKKTTPTSKTGGTTKTAVAATPPAKRGPGRPRKAAPVEEEISGDTPEGATDETAGGEVDLDNLAELAEGGDDEAKEKLGDLAKSLGFEESDITSADNWAAVVDMIREAQSSDESPNEDEPAEEVAEDETPEPPAKGDVVGYKPVVKGEKSKKVINHEVMSVNTEKGFVTLKNLVNNGMVMTKDGKNKLAVKFEDLLPSV